MFNFFNKKIANTKDMQTIDLKIKGMHCASCALNIDGELEDLTGVERAETSYARADSKVTFDPKQVTVGKIQQTISKLGYDTEIA